jgi:nucleoid-associated protein YgaU
MAKLNKGKLGANQQMGLVTEEGDTAWSIAKEFSPDQNPNRWTELVDANPDHFAQNLKMKAKLPLILPEGWGEDEPFQPSGM